LSALDKTCPTVFSFVLSALSVSVEIGIDMSFP